MNKKEILELIDDALKDFTHNYYYIECKKGKEVSRGFIDAGSYKHAAKILFNTDKVKQIDNNIENRKLHVFYISLREGYVVDYAAKLFKKD